MAVSREEWKAKSLELSELYDQNPECEARQLGQHRHFISTNSPKHPFASAHAVWAGLRGMEMCAKRSHSQNIRGIANSLVKAGYRRIDSTDSEFGLVWRSYAAACGKVGAIPSGGPDLKDTDRTFFVNGSLGLLGSEVAGSEKGKEGAIIQYTSNRYERSKRLRNACIAHYLTNDGCICCEVCGMDFVSCYGDIGNGFIHIHHVNPLGNAQEEHEVDPIKDLKPVCPNCHAMLHKKPGRSAAYTIAELQSKMKET